MLRKGEVRIVITDFGVARRIISKTVPRGRTPVGTPTHFSPEKAQCVGHGHVADVWASMCVLIHMLSGSPPWVKRFPNLSTLSYIVSITSMCVLINMLSGSLPWFRRFPNLSTVYITLILFKEYFYNIFEILSFEHT